MKISVDLRDFDKAVAMLDRAKRSAFPFAMRNALNDGAFQLKREWGQEIREKFTTRTPWTSTRAIEIEKAKGVDVSRMEAVVGHVAPFMALQERGGIVRGGRKHRPIPGPSAAGQSPGSTRTKLIRAPNKLRALKASSAPKTGQSRKQRNAVAIAIARRKGQKAAVLERPSGGRAIFGLSGGARRVRTRLLWDLSRGSARVPPHETLGPSLVRINRGMLGIYHRAILDQLRRHRLFGF